MSAFLILSATARREEVYLRATFGPAYATYAARVPRIWPKPSLFQTKPMVNCSVATLRTNFADGLVFLGFIPLAELMEWVKEIGLVGTFPLY